jgi:uncharacterized membrane protein YeaQ/YmgE (transglycosylase-associated protein family)
MEGLGWFSFLIVGLVAGYVAEKIMKRDQGLLTNLIVGAIALLWIVGKVMGGRRA